MKKFLSIFLSITMLLSITAGLNLTANAYTEGGYEYYVEDDNAIISGYSGEISGDITIPSTLGGLPVTRIDDKAFESCTSITGVTIPDSVTVIRLSVFRNCTSLVNINLPENLTYIGLHAFDNTEFYNTLSNWIDDVLYIGNYLIEAKTTISGAYDVKDGTTLIARWAFYNCNHLLL